MDFVQDEKIEDFLQAIHMVFQFTLHGSVLFMLNKETACRKQHTTSSSLCCSGTFFKKSQSYDRTTLHLLYDYLKIFFS